MSTINPNRLLYFPEYYTQFDTSVVWEGNTCTNTVLSGDYRVRLTLEPICVNDLPGVVPHIVIWDGTQYVEQTEWIGPPYEWLCNKKSDMAHIVGACANAILVDFDNQSWQYIVTAKPIETPTLTNLLLEVLGKVKGMGSNAYETPTVCYEGRAKKTAPRFAISTHHLQAIAHHFDRTIVPDATQLNRPRWCMF